MLIAYNAAEKAGDCVLGLDCTMEDTVTFFWLVRLAALDAVTVR